MKVVTTLESIIKCSTRVMDAVISPSQTFSNAGSTCRQISAGSKKKLSNISFGFLQLDWCPVDLRTTRNKFMYKKDDVGALVNLYVENSGQPKFALDSKVSRDVMKMEPKQIGRIGALMNIAESILPLLSATDDCKGPVEAYPTLTGQR
jgi:hypothetical protein